MIQRLIMVGLQDRMKLWRGMAMIDRRPDPAAYERKDFKG